MRRRSCESCGLLCQVCTHYELTPAEDFVEKLESLIYDYNYKALKDIVSVTSNGNAHSKNYSINIVKPEHIEGCWL